MKPRASSLAVGLASVIGLGWLTACKPKPAPAPAPAQAAAAAAPAAARPRLPKVPWSVELLYGENEIFPSALLTLTDDAPFPPNAALPPQLGDPRGLIAVKLTAPRDGCRVRVEIAPTILFDRSSAEVVLPRAGETYRIAPWLRLDPDRLLTIRHPIAGEALRVTTTIDGEAQVAEHLVRVHALNDCLTGINIGPLSYETPYLSASFANEFTPELVTKLTQHALRRHYVERFDGYDSNDVKQVRRQVEAIYRTLHDFGFKYSTIYNASFTSRPTSTQWIRRPAESMRSDLANCADGTVLFAALLRQIQLRPVIFFHPYDHVFLGVYLTERGGEQDGFDAVETTLVGYASFDRARAKGANKLAALRKKPGRREVTMSEEDLRHPYAWDSAPKDAEPNVFFHIDLAAARGRGIYPLPEDPAFNPSEP